MSNFTLSIVIPTLNAAAEIGGLVDSLRCQTLPPDEIVVIDSGSEDDTADIVRKIGGVRVLSVKRESFNHGLTRDWALRQTYGDFVFFFTQDVVIDQHDFIMRMLEPFADAKVAMVYARQVAKPDARKSERYVREFNYPTTRQTRAMNDIPSLGVKAFFHSDVAACYRRSAYLAIGGFEKVVTNEDMLIAARALYAGWKTVYAGDAEVMHSHNLSLRQEFRRNVLIARFLAAYPELFGAVGVRGEGWRMIRQVTRRLIADGHILELVYFWLRCLVKLAGNNVGGRTARRNLI